MKILILTQDERLREAIGRTLQCYGVDSETRRLTNKTPMPAPHAFDMVLTSWSGGGERIVRLCQEAGQPVAVCTGGVADAVREICQVPVLELPADTADLYRLLQGALL